jgi:hypothetical protein
MAMPEDFPLTGIAAAIMLRAVRRLCLRRSHADLHESGYRCSGRIRNGEWVFTNNSRVHMM